MSVKIFTCVLTGEKLDTPFVESGIYYAYTGRKTGKVQIAISVVNAFHEEPYNYYPTLAALCREAHENKVDPPLITSDFINHVMPTLSFPRRFKEKVAHFLKWFYNHGGDDFKPKTFDVSSDFYIAFADDGEEFNRILAHLNNKMLIEWAAHHGYIGGGGLYLDVLMTDAGIQEVEKDMPKVPMVGLINQYITTGNETIDEKINHAKKLFFDEPQTMEHMRSACVTLAAVLEPLRGDLTSVIARPDVEAFFQLVNNFDIRHNHHKVMTLEYPEQLEWVFYSLLNTINVYYKLKVKLT